MVGQATEALGMSFETQRALEVMKEFSLTGLAGANLPPPHELLADPGFRMMIKTDPITREFFVHLGGVKLKEAISGLF